MPLCLLVPMWFQIDGGIGDWVTEAAGECGVDDTFSPDVRRSDPRFGDFQANGVLAYAKEHRLNPRQLAEKIIARLSASGPMVGKIAVTAAGPGFINFTLSDEFLGEWLNAYRSEEDFRLAVSRNLKGRRFVVDYSSPNTAKQMHVGHLRSMNIGNSIVRMLKFCGAEVIGDNHVGDWGTQFGILLLAIGRSGVDVGRLSIGQIEELYQRGTAMVDGDDGAMAAARRELVKLQGGDRKSLEIWRAINDISLRSFDEIYDEMGISFDLTLGESFYRHTVERVWEELIAGGIAVEDNGALCVFHGEHDRFATQPFIVRKADGASNYAATDLATVLYRTEQLHADGIIYVTDGRQRDHFEQLFLTVEKWYAAFGRKCPEMRHIWFGTILGEDGKAIRTRAGGTVRLRELLDEAKRLARAMVDGKSTDLPPEERQHVGDVLGIDSVKYADLLSARTNDYEFSYGRMLSFDGNTAAYLLYAIARLRSILKKCGVDPAFCRANALETEEERALVRQLTHFPIILARAVEELLPHHLCTYLFALTGAYSSFYNANRIIGESPDTTARRLTIVSRTLSVLEAGLHLLGLETLERM
jgi:arginyl-tRNA synthetase